MAEQDASPALGRPSKYKPEYCQEAIIAGSQGLSLTALAGMLDVDRDTITEWIKVHPEFSLACKRHKAKRALTLETGMLDPSATGPMVTARRFALANAAPEEWREKLDTTNHNFNASLDVNGQLNQQQMNNIAKMVLEKGGYDIDDKAD